MNIAALFQQLCHPILRGVRQYFQRAACFKAAFLLLQHADLRCRECTIFRKNKVTYYGRGREWDGSLWLAGGPGFFSVSICFLKHM